MKIESLKKGIKIKSWGSLYLGVHNNWIDPKWIIENMEDDNIQFKTEDYSRLVLAEKGSIFGFLKVLKEISVEYKETEFLVNEDSQYDNFVTPLNFPREYWDFWEAEFIIQTIDSKLSLDDKLKQLESIYQDFYYPEDWTKILNKDREYSGDEFKVKLLNEISEYANNK